LRRRGDALRAGFTLVELLVVMGIVLVVASLAAAAFSSMTRGRTVAAAAHGIRTVLVQARSYAATHNVQTRVLLGTNAAAQQYALVQWRPGPGDPWREEIVAKPYYLRRGVEYYYNNVGPPPDPLKPAKTLERVGKLVNFGYRDAGQQYMLVFNPSGGLAPVANLGTDNVQIGLMGQKLKEYKAVTVLFASGLPYVEEAQ
jgi:prepilin-type N-terminal cleavage/methylation domain-containing protein